MMGTWVYKQTEPGLWTVGTYDGDGKWQPETDHGASEEAAKRVRYLNGGGDAEARSRATLTRDIDVAESTAARSLELAGRQHHPALAGELRRGEGFAAGVAAYARLVRDGETSDELARLLDF